MKSLTREEQALCLSVYAFSETMFKTSMGKTGTSFSGDKGLKLLSVGEVKVKQKGIASTQHLPFPHKLKLRMAQSQTPREAADDPCTISRRDWNFPAVWEPDALLAPKVRSGDRQLPSPALKEATLNEFEVFQQHLFHFSPEDHYRSGKLTSFWSEETNGF